MKNTSSFIKIDKSDIHNLGAFAIRDIRKGTKIIEYVGEIITKTESKKRSQKIFQEHLANKDKGSVYIFTLNNEQDLDGNVSYNTARFLNHSCNPNCEAINENSHIWIYALNDIKKGDELTYNYRYPIETWKKHRCRCGSNKCVGYIVKEEDRGTLRFLKIMLYLEKFINNIFNGKK